MPISLRDTVKLSDKRLKDVRAFLSLLDRSRILSIGSFLDSI